MKSSLLILMQRTLLFIVIDSEGLNVMDYKDGEFVEGTQLAYWTAEDTLSELDSIDNK